MLDAIDPTCRPGKLVNSLYVTRRVDCLFRLCVYSERELEHHQRRVYWRPTSEQIRDKRTRPRSINMCWYYVVVETCALANRQIKNDTTSRVYNVVSQVEENCIVESDVGNACAASSWQILHNTTSFITLEKRIY